MSKYKFKTTNIRGKQYVEVNERIKFFRQEEEYKNWTISTEFTALDAEQCVCKAIVADTNQRVIATGHAHEERSASHINKTSYVENCETSAIGRALAMMGIGIDTKALPAGRHRTPLRTRLLRPGRRPEAARSGSCRHRRCRWRG